MTQPFQVPNELRDFAEKSVDQARTAVETLFSNAAKAAEQLQTSGHSFQSNLQGAVAKGFDFAQTNTHATFDFAQKLVRTRDVREAMALQGEFIRSQIATLQAQAKDLGALAQNTLRPSA